MNTCLVLLAYLSTNCVFIFISYLSLDIVLQNEKLSHITGTFVVDAMPSFLNGAGIDKNRRDQNYTILKTFQDGVGEREDGWPRRYRTVFVSAQSFRRMLRHTMLQETGWEESQMRALANNPDGHTEKASTERDPISYFEDDIFGYFFTQPGAGKVKITTRDAVEKPSAEDVDNANTEPESEEPTKRKGEPIRVKTVYRTSPLSTSIWVGLRKDGWEGKSESFVSLNEGTSLPYSTQFANTPFTGIFGLNYARLCRYINVGDRIELDDQLVKKYLDNKMIVEIEAGQPEFYSLESITAEVTQPKGKSKKIEIFSPNKKYGKVYELTNAAQTRKERAAALIKSLAVLRGGAKQAAFETDVSPKVLILAGLTCGNPIFNTLFEDDNSGGNRSKTVSIKVLALKEIVDDYKDRICTPVFVGIRKGYIKNENEVTDSLKKKEGFIVTTPIGAAREICRLLPGSTNDK
jgi:CRISPR-associated protein Cst2